MCYLMAHFSPVLICSRHHCQLKWIFYVVMSPCKEIMNLNLNFEIFLCFQEQFLTRDFWE